MKTKTSSKRNRSRLCDRGGKTLRRGKTPEDLEAFWTAGMAGAEAPTARGALESNLETLRAAALPLSGADSEAPSLRDSQSPRLDSPRLDSPRLAGKRPKGMRKRKAAKKPRRRSLTPEEVLAGMRPEEIEEIQALLGREQSAADFRRVDLERFNHAVLVFFQRVFAVMHLRPFQVEKLTCVTHQHQLKLHPHAHAEEDVHVNLYLAGQICNGLHLRLLRVLEWVFKKCTPVWPLLVPLEA